MKSTLREPTVSVVLPVYNASAFLSEAVRSILNQSFHDLELIAIDDGSTDGSLKILRCLAESDDRLRVISRENRGLVATLNEGVALAKGRYLARMDADDISLTRRIEKQVGYLNENHDIDVVGCHYELIDEAGAVKRVVRVPLSRESIFLQLSYTVPFAHPSVMIRRDVLVNNPYIDVDVEDYRLWVDLFNGMNFSNIDSVLIKYRHDYGGSFSDTKRLEMIEAEEDVRNVFFKRFISDYEKLISQANRVNDKKRLARSLVENLRRVPLAALVRGFLASPILAGLSIFYLFRRQARMLYWRIRRG